MSSTDTFGTWASRIGSESEIPESFIAAYKDLHLSARQFPLVLYSPVFKFDRHENPPKLLISTEGRIVCLNDKGGQVERTELSLDDVYSAEWGTVLLKSWICFNAQGEQGASSIRVEFNSTSRDLYLPILKEYRSRHYAGAEASHAPPEFDQLNRVNYKFMNFARASMEKGVEVRQVYLHGTVSTKILGMFSKIRIAASMAIATQKELIIIREGDEKTVGYLGGIWSYFHLEKIKRVYFERAEKDILEMRVVLPGDTVAVCEYSPEKEHEIASFLEGVRRSNPHIGS